MEISRRVMKSNNNDKTFQNIPIHLNFNVLPAEVQDRLLKRQRGESEGIAIKTAEVKFSIVLISLAILWFVLLYLLTNDYLWGNPRIIIFGLISFGAAYLLLTNGYKLARWLTSRTENCLLITPLYVIDINFNDVRYWNLEQLISIDNLDRQQNGNRQSTRITLKLENGLKTFNVKDINTAEQTVEKINIYRKLFIEASVRNDTEYLNSNDDFIGLTRESSESNKTPRGLVLPRIAAILTAGILTVGIMFGGISLNNYYDDKKGWDYAQTFNRASSYRKYLQTHPEGRWTGDANINLQTLYDAAEQNYKTTLNKGFDQQAVDAVLEILKYAKSTQNYRVKVVFEKNNEISPNIVEELKEEFEVKNILPLGDSLSDEKMSRREGSLLAVISGAFKQVIPDDILELSNECSGECVTFLVKYKINAKASVYYDSRQEDLPDNEKVFYPGILIDWDFGVQIPNQSKNYNFSLESIPAQTINYDSNLSEADQTNKDFSDVLNADRGNIYDSMVQSAFEDFRANLVFKMGIGEAPKRNDESANDSVMLYETNGVGDRYSS